MGGVVAGGSMRCGLMRRVQACWECSVRRLSMCCVYDAPGWAELHYGTVLTDAARTEPRAATHQHERHSEIDNKVDHIL